MKTFLLLVLACSVSIKCFSQTTVNADTSLKFNKSIIKCEKQWVILPKRDTALTYTYGYVYIDGFAGFTFDIKGKLTIDKYGKYKGDTSMMIAHMMKIRIPANPINVAIISPKHYQELNLKAEPSWLKIYYDYKDTTAHEVRWGSAYNGVKEPAIALAYLNKAYKVSPHAAGLEYEMAYAYNISGQYDDAIKIMKQAIANKPEVLNFYEELGFAYLSKKEYEKAIDAFSTGVNYGGNYPSEEKSGLAINVAVAYKSLGNNDDYRNWMIKAKSFAPVNSVNYKTIVRAGF